MLRVAAFLSYDHRDADAASSVYARFTSLSTNNMVPTFLPSFKRKYYIDTWVDSVSIPLGSQWKQAIARAIKTCHVLVLIASEAHYSSYVADEVGMALSLNKPVFPLYVDSPTALNQYEVGHVQGLRIPPHAPQISQP